jgi:hypothetical protein
MVQTTANSSEQCNGSKNSLQCNGSKNVSSLHSSKTTRRGTTMQQCLPHLLKFKRSYQGTAPNLAMQNKHCVCSNYQAKTIQTHPNGTKYTQPSVIQTRLGVAGPSAGFALAHTIPIVVKMSRHFCLRGFKPAPLALPGLGAE